MLSSRFVDSVRKGNDSLKSQQAPYLVIQDRDEDTLVQDEDSNLFVWSVREVENLFLTKNSIHGVAQEFFEDFGIDWDDNTQSKFEETFSDRIRKYAPKWHLLNFQTLVGKTLRPIWNHGDKPQSSEDLKRYVQEVIDGFKNRAEVETAKLDRIEASIDSIVKSSISDDGTPNYEHVCENLPGKDLISLVRTALVGGLMMLDVDVDKKKAEGQAGNFTGLRNFLNHLEYAPSELDRFISKLRKVHHGSCEKG